MGAWAIGGAVHRAAGEAASAGRADPQSEACTDKEIAFIGLDALPSEAALDGGIPTKPAPESTCRIEADSAKVAAKYHVATSSKATAAKPMPCLPFDPPQRPRFGPPAEPRSAG